MLYFALIIFSSLMLSCSDTVEFSGQNPTLTPNPAHDFITPNQPEAPSPIEEATPPEHKDLITATRHLTQVIKPHKSYNFKIPTPKKQSFQVELTPKSFHYQETFLTQKKAKLDLLLVIDNSNTMKAIQQKLVRRFQSLLKYLEDIDWKIVATTTSYPSTSHAHTNIHGAKYAPCLLQPTAHGKKSLSRDDYTRNKHNALQDFAKLIASAGIHGSTTEQGIRAATEAALGDCGDVNRDWKRIDSHLAVLIVTDERNCGSSNSSQNCRKKPWGSQNYFLDKVAKHRDKVSVFGLLLLKDTDGTDPICHGSGGYDDEYPSEYISLIEATNGVYGEVCQEDYSSVLAEVGQHLSDKIITRFDLKHEPVSASIKIFSGDRSLDYTLDGKTVFIKKSDIQDSKTITVRYQSTQEFYENIAIPQEADLNRLEIYLDNKPLDPSQYHITAHSALKLGFTVSQKRFLKVVYNEKSKPYIKVPLPSDFGQLISLRHRGIDIDAKAVAQKGRFIYINSLNMIDSINIGYSPYDAVQTDYTVDNINEDMHLVRAYELGSDKDIDAHWDGKQVRFAEADVKSKRRIGLVFKAM